MWLRSQFSISPTIDVGGRVRDIQHGRMIAVTWKSGKQRKIYLDQGMGYWRPSIPYRDQLSFDFNHNHENQAMQLLE